MILGRRNATLAYDQWVRTLFGIVGRRIASLNLRPEGYNFQSPYVYAANDPIKFIEVRGEGPGVPDIETTITNTKGDGLYRTANAKMRITLKIVNLAGADLSSEFSSNKGSINLTGTFGGKADYTGENYPYKGDLEGQDIDYDVRITNVTVDYEIVSSLDDVGENDHVMMIVDEIPKGIYGEAKEESDPIGLATLGGHISAVEAKTLKDGTFKEVSQHELGHNLGLKHTDRERALLYESVNGGFGLSKREKGTVLTKSTGVMKFLNDGVSKASESALGYHKHSKSLAEGFLKNNGNPITY